MDKQYMLGDSLLVAPIFNEEGIANYYLPVVKWTDFFTGEVTFTKSTDYLNIGDTFLFKTKAEGMKDKVVWSVSDTSVAIHRR